MPVLYNPQTNFTAGEWSGDMAGRSDLAKFRNAARTIENFLPTPQGRLLTTPGLRFVARAKYADKKCLLLPFRFSFLDAMIMEVGDLYMRFHTNNGRIEEAVKAVVSLADNGSGRVRVEVTAHGYTTGDSIRLSTVVDGEVLNDDWVITVIDVDNFDLDGSTFTGTPTSGVVNKIVEIVTPYLEADLFSLHIEQQADTVYFFHKAYQQRTLIRTNATSYTLAAFLTTFGPFLDDNITAITIASTGTTGTVTLTASASLFQADHVGALWRIAGKTGTPARSGHVRITVFTSVTEVTALVLHDLSSGAATTDWAEGAWSDVRGWPATVDIFDERLSTAGTDTEPIAFWASKPGEFSDFDVGIVADGDALDLDLSVSDRIRWLKSLTFMFVGTDGETGKIGGGTDLSALTPKNRFFRRQTGDASKDIQPVLVGGDLIHVQAAGKRLFIIEFQLARDQFIGKDITILAEHVTGPGIVQMAYQQEPYSWLWCVRSDGVMAVVCLKLAQEVIGWVRRVTKGLFESVASIPHPDGDRNQVWVSVNRTVNGTVARYIEYFDDSVGTPPLDSFIAYTGTATKALSGLNHLEGESVAITSTDHGDNIPLTVSTGEITGLTGSVTTAWVGLKLTPKLVPFLPEATDELGSIQPRTKRVVSVTLLTDGAKGLAIEGVVHESVRLNWDTPALIYPGFITIEPEVDYGQELTITQEFIHRSTILSLYQKIEVGDQ